MPVRKLTLQEWFLAHQLEKLGRGHFYVPFALDADITRVEEAYRARGEKTPYTAVVVKAMALAACRRPAMNRMFVPTFYGPRIVEFDHVSVSLPVIMNRDGERYLGAVTVRDADRLSVRSIRDAIRAGRLAKPEDLPVGRYVYGRRNHFLNRMRLRAIHFAVYNFPGLFLAEKAGGLAVTSMVSEVSDVRTRPTGFGPTAFTATMCSVDRDAPGKTILKLGIGVDHSVCRGDEAAASVQLLSDILGARADRDLEALTR